MKNDEETKDILKFSKDHSFDLYVTKGIMKSMLVNCQYRTIELLQKQAVQFRFVRSVTKQNNGKI